MPAKKQKLYVRNLLYSQASVTIGNPKSPNAFRYDLSPRGMRGDTAPIENNQDESVAGNPNNGLVYEIITQDEAQQVYTNQTTNQQEVHPAAAALKDHLGNPVERAVVAKGETVQGRTVATINERGDITRFETLGTRERPFQGEGQVDDAPQP